MVCACVGFRPFQTWRRRLGLTGIYHPSHAERIAVRLDVPEASIWKGSFALMYATIKCTERISESWWNGWCGFKAGPLTCTYSISIFTIGM